MDTPDLDDGRLGGPEEALALTQRMSTAGHRATRWLALFLVLYGVGIGIVGIVLGATGSQGMVAVMMGAWAVFVALTTAWASRQRGAIRGMRLIMIVWAACFVVCWGVTVWVGSTWFQQVMVWWIGCAVVTFLVHLALAAWVWRRSVRR